MPATSREAARAAASRAKRSAPDRVPRGRIQCPPKRRPLATAAGKGKLKHFDRLFLSRREAWFVLRFMFGKVGMPPPDSNKPRDLPCHYIYDEDVQFAQALLVRAIDASKKMNFAEKLFRGTANPTGSVKSIIKGFAKSTVRDWANAEGWFDHADKDDVRKHKIYESVVNTIRDDWNDAWHWRVTQCQPILEYSE
ncbi:MAG: hypothetical protein ABW208_24810 [Pyrinomonadaceae bacterium]